MLKTKRQKEFEKVIKVIQSCMTKDQLEVASTMGAFYCANYSPDTYNDLRKLNRVYSLRYCQLGLHKEIE